MLSGAGETELIFTGDTDWLLLLAGENSSDRDRAGEGVEAPPAEPGPEVAPLDFEPPAAAAAAAARCSRANLALALMSAKVRAPVHPGRILGGVKGCGVKGCGVNGVLGETWPAVEGAGRIRDTGILRGGTLCCTITEEAVARGNPSGVEMRGFFSDISSSLETFLFKDSTVTTELGGTVPSAFTDSISNISFLLEQVLTAS